MGLYSGGLIIGRIFASETWEAYFREGLFLGGLIIGMLRYLCCICGKTKNNGLFLLTFTIFGALKLSRQVSLAADGHEWITTQ